MYKDYSSIEKFLHNLSLSSKEIKKIFFFLEKKIFGNNTLINNHSNNIFLGGLPRCGSTAILYFLNESNEFGALKYRNMPFILSPKINQIIFNNLKKISIKERTHGDGLKFSLNTPEAFDEIFFSIFTDVEDKILSENYCYYINQVLKLQNKNRYLSKNNNLYKRIDFLTNYFEKSNKLFIIRNPYNQSYSLLRQHLKFCELQKKDVFVKKYILFDCH